MSADAWTAVGSIATVIGVIAAIILGVIPLVRDRNKISAVYAPPSTTSGAPQPMPTIATKAPASAPMAAGPVHPAYSPESRRGVGLRGVFWSLLPLASFFLAGTVSGSLKGQGFNGPLAWLGILAAFLLSAPFIYYSIRLRNFKLALTGVVYGAVALFLSIMTVIEDHEFWTGGFSESSSHYLDGIGVSWIVLSVAATIHAFWLRRRVYARST